MQRVTNWLFAVHDFLMSILMFYAGYLFFSSIMFAVVSLISGFSVGMLLDFMPPLFKIAVAGFFFVTLVTAIGIFVSYMLYSLSKFAKHRSFGAFLILSIIWLAIGFPLTEASYFHFSLLAICWLPWCLSCMGFSIAVKANS